MRNDISPEYLPDYHRERIEENNKKINTISPVLGGIFLIYLLWFIFFKNKANQIYYISYIICFSAILINALIFKLYYVFSIKIKSLKVQDGLVHIFYIMTFIILIGINILNIQGSMDYLPFAAGLLSIAFLLRTSLKIFLTIALSGFILFIIGLTSGFQHHADFSILLPMAVVITLSLYFHYHGENTRCRIFQLTMSLRETSIKDPLTEAYNRRFMIETLHGEIAKWVRTGTPLSLIMLDIDFFKKVNDDYNHSTGDRVLLEMCKTINDCIRDSDLLCRYGGEEFVIILENANRDSAYNIAERIRKTIENHDFEGIIDRKITISLGISLLEQGDSEMTLIQRADENLYKSKRLGRNRTSF